MQTELIKIENFELSPLDNKIVSEINDLIEKVKQYEKDEIQFKVNRNFRYNPGNSMTEINIQNASISELIDITSFINFKSREYEKAAEEILGLSNYPAFTWLGFTSDQWFYDIQNVIANAEKQNQKLSIELRLKELLSVLPEDVKKIQVLAKKPKFE